MRVLNIGSSILAGPSMVRRPCVFPERHSLAVFHPPPGDLETIDLAPEGYMDSGLSTEVFDAILNARAPSTRKLYVLKWCLFSSKCQQHHLNPIGVPSGASVSWVDSRDS